jgi:hypothetical protein
MERESGSIPAVTTKTFPLLSSAIAPTSTMPVYDVTIKATIAKTIRLHAKDQDEAVQQAHELFTPYCDGSEERYEQEFDSIVEVEA